jgi:hypothetical protein
LELSLAFSGTRNVTWQPLAGPRTTARSSLAARADTVLRQQLATMVTRKNLIYKKNINNETAGQ